MDRQAKIVAFLICLATVVSISLLFFWGGVQDRQVAIRTLALGFGAGLVAVPIGIAITWVCRSRSTVSNLLLLTCVGLVFMPLFLQVSAWDSAFGKLGWLSTRGESLQPLLTGWSAAIWIHGVSAAPQVALIMVIGLTLFGRAEEEQAMLDASSAAVFWNVTLRQLMPLVAVGFIWTLVISAREIAVTDIYQIGTLAEQVYLGYSLGQFNTGINPWSAEAIAQAESTSWQLTVAVIFWIVVVFVLASSSYLRAYSESNHWTENRKSLHPMTISKRLTGIVVLCVIAVVPIGNLVLRASFGVERVDGEPVPVHSLGRLTDSISQVFSQYVHEFQWSMAIATVSAVVLILAALWFSWLAIENAWWRMAFVVSIGVLASVPGPLLGVAGLELFTSTDQTWLAYLFDRTIFPAVLVTAAFCWPLVGLITYCVLAGTATDSLENAKLEGAGRLTRLFRIAFLQNVLGVAGCFLVAWILAFGELSASQMILPAGIDTVPRRMLGLLHSGVNELTAAFSIVNFFVIFVVAMAGWQLIRKSRRNSR
jgi:iron(III) transport system permease protein